MENFAEADIVTPLPCDIRHVYHAACIEKWFVDKGIEGSEAICPMCRVEVTDEEI
jgi:hypothetical protein